MKRIILLLAASTLLGCRDGVDGFEPFAVVPAPAGPLTQLTYSGGREQHPVWSAHGDSIFYATTHFEDVPLLGRTMLGIARGGSIATLLLPDAHPKNANNITLPALAPDGFRVAYVDLVRVDVPLVCEQARIPPPRPEETPCAFVPQPLLDSAVLRVRDLRQQGMVDLASHGIKFSGARARNNTVLATFAVHAFQAQFTNGGPLKFRISWSPAGDRLVFSDGLDLYLWSAGDAPPTKIPNTRLGVSPAWSPDGNTIAFTRYVIADSSLARCLCKTPDDIPDEQRHDRMSYSIAQRYVTLIAPDGTGATQLTTGEEPAWTPDGNSIYYVDDGVINRIAPAGGAPTRFETTQRGHSPAVSPDGRRLAFSRPKSLTNKDEDIWIIDIGDSQ